MAATFIVVVFVVLLSYWLSCWLSCCCFLLSRVVVVATAGAATTKPPMHSGRRHRRGHLHHRCRRNHIRCSYQRHPHLAAAFTAVVNATVIAPAAASTMQIPSMSLPSPLHSLQPLLPPSLSPPLSRSPQSVLTSPPALVRRCLILGLAVTSARQGVTPCSSRHGREVWR